MDADCLIRPGRSDEVEALLAIERRAAQLLLGHGAYSVFAMHSLSIEDLCAGISEGILRVAERDGVQVGFALAGTVDGQAHLFEMDVVPECGGRGVGTALLEAVCAAAKARGFLSMTLTTLRDVPWNAPFYVHRGFVELSAVQWGPQLTDIVRVERLLGFSPELRVVMRRML